MATVISKQIGASQANVKSGSTTILGASDGSKTVVSFRINWGSSSSQINGWLYDYDIHSSGGINFYINGTYVCQATYDGRTSRPVTVWNGTISIPPKTAITVSFSSSHPNSSRAIHNAVIIEIAYNQQAHPTVTAGNPIKNSEIAALNYYKNNSNTGPGVGVKIEPYVIGTKNTTITASQYNNA